jgi:hypothetical protein
LKERYNVTLPWSVLPAFGTGVSAVGDMDGNAAMTYYRW